MSMVKSAAVLIGLKIVPVPSYANAGGTGDRTGSITVTTDISLGSGVISQSVNGNTTENDWYFSSGQSFPRFIKFDFGTPKIINAFKWYQSGATDQGAWKWQSSPDDSSYTDRGNSFLLVGDAAGSEITEPAGNTIAARYWKMVSVAGQTNGGPYQREIEFKIAAG